MAKGVVNFAAVGDVGPRRQNADFPHKLKEKLFDLTAPILKKADLSFCQLEVILSARPDPLYNEASHPDNIQQLTPAGFTVVSFAGNHHMDSGVEAFVDTLDVLKANGMQPLGVGMNIAEARTPVVVDRNGTKVAFVGYSSIIPKAEVPYDAEENRPGCAPMYVSTYYEASDWQPGTPNPHIISIADKNDVESMRQDIARAKELADVVVMSIHWGVHRVPGLIAMYQYEVGHAAIDAGADMVLGHHAHIIKGIEVYKGKPIFYSLGNFGLDKVLPRRVEGRWDAINMSPPDPNYPTVSARPDGRKTMIVNTRIVDGKVERISFLPCMINNKGQPEPLTKSDPRSDEVFDYVKWACADQNIGTKFERDGDEIVVLTK